MMYFILSENLLTSSEFLVAEASLQTTFKKKNEISCKLILY